MKNADSIYKPYNWRKRLEEYFPKVPSHNDKKAYSDFLSRIHKNYKNHRVGYLDGENWQFGWFFQSAKIANRKYREANIFLLWLWLCVARPWKEKTFFMEWGETKKKDFYKSLDILNDLENKFGLKFPGTQKVSGIKTFDRYKKDDLLRINITSIFTKGYADFWKDLDSYKYQIKFRKLLESGSLITKREYQKKLRISSNLMDQLVDEFKKKGLLEIKNRPKKSVWLLYNDPKKRGNL